MDIKKRMLRKYFVRIIICGSILFLVTAVMYIILFVIIVVNSGSHTWLDSTVYTFAKRDRICISKIGELYPRLTLDDAGIEINRFNTLDDNVYAYEGDENFFQISFKGDVFYSYGSSGFYVIYADPFEIKLLRDKTLPEENWQPIAKALSNYSTEELMLLDSENELTAKERTAYAYLQKKAEERQKRLAGETIYIFSQNPRIKIKQIKELSQRWYLEDTDMAKKELDYNVYAYEEDKEKGVFYSYGSSGFYAIYADPFRIKYVVEQWSIDRERKKSIEETFRQYSEDEFVELPDKKYEQTSEERKAYYRLRDQSSDRIKKLKSTSDY